MASSKTKRILAYVDGEWERVVLEPIVEHLNRIGLIADLTEDFTIQSDVGLYACHGNRFFNFSTGNWNPLPSRLSVLCVHDFEQITPKSIDAFMNDGWHRFDLALVPNHKYLFLGERADHLGYKLPQHGLRVIGWPPSDKHFAQVTEKTRFESPEPAVLQTNTKKKRVFLACSWSSPKQILDCHSVLGTDDYEFIVRYPNILKQKTNSPWKATLDHAIQDVKSAIKIAKTLPATHVPDTNANLFDLLVSSDVIVSNGSNVTLEGVIVGKPGICVTSWTHPSGPEGTERYVPELSQTGVLNGTLEELPNLVATALSNDFRPYVLRGQNELLPPQFRGSASLRASEEIENLIKALESDSQNPC